MSHFSLIVVGGTEATLAALMAPYNEQTDDRQFLEFQECEAEYRQKYETESVEMVRLVDGQLKYTWDDDFKVRTSSFFDTKKVYPEDSTLVQVPHKERFTSFEEFMAEWVEMPERDAEHNLYGYWRNPNAKWDWYSVGGRWMGYFKAKPGTCLHLGQSGSFDNTAAPGTSDLLTLGEWDLTSQRAEAVAEARKRYETFYGLLGGRPLPPAWKAICAQHGDVEKAREAYQADPTVRFMNEHKEVFEPYNGFFMDAGAEFGVPLETYLEKASAATGVPFAIIKDGQWYERGSMGWWGCVSDEKDYDEWCRQVAALFDGLPQDTPLIAVDCHI